MSKEYEENEVAADQKYEGKLLAVNGKVASVDTMFGQTSVTLKGKDMSLVSVQCFFEDDQKAALANLKKGQQVTIQGVCDGKSMNVSLKKCAVK